MPQQGGDVACNSPHLCPSTKLCSTHHIMSFSKTSIHPPCLPAKA